MTPNASLPPAERAVAELTHLGRRRIPALTGIRGYAALWVMFFHMFLMAVLKDPGGAARPSWPVVGRGYLGVDLFFLLSGYVLMLTYGDALTGPDRAGAIRSFAIGRGFRILPLHWVVLAFVLVATTLMPGPWVGIEPTGPGLLLQHVLLVQEWTGHPLVWNTPAWSLSAEMMAYVLFPLLVPRIARLGRRGCWLALAGAYVLLVGGVEASGGGMDHLRSVGLLRCLCEFPMGMVACRLRSPDPASRQGTPMVLAGFVLLTVSLTTRRLDPGVVPAFLLLISAAGSSAPLPARLFGNRVAVYLGEISFSIYLLHVLLLNLAWRATAGLLQHVPGRLTGVMALAGFAVILCAHLTWRFVELPAQALGRRRQRRQP